MFLLFTKGHYLIASHRQEVTATSTLPGNLTLPHPHHTQKKIFALFWAYMVSDSGQLSDLSQHSFNFMMQTKTLLRATSPRVPSTPRNCRKEGVCCREEWLQMSLHLPDPSCDLAQSLRVKNNHGLKLGVKSKLLGWVTMKTRRKKASHEFPADGARWGEYRGLGAPPGERRCP